VSHKFDIIIVGAGPAGLAAAYELCRRGFKVVVLERGKRPGSKNMYGGRIYISEIEKHSSDIAKDIQKIGRRVIRETIMLTYGKTSLYFTIEADDWSGGVVTSLTRFVENLAQKVESSGGILVTSARVDSLIVQDGNVRGVRCGVDTLNADFIIDSEGVNRILLENSKLVDKISPDNVALGLKEVYRVDSNDINKIFDLEDDKSMTVLALGEVLGYIPGGAFMYIDRGYVHIGFVIYLSHYYKIKNSIIKFFENIYKLPLFRQVVKYGERVEYGAKLVPVTPLPSISPVNRLAVIGDAGGYIVHIGPIIRGVDYAVLSGLFTARAIVDMMEREKEREYTYDRFNQYLMKYMKNSSMIRDLELFRKVYQYYKAEDIYRKYVGFIVDFARNYLEVKDYVKSMSEAFYIASRRHGLSIWNIAIDYIKKFRKM